MELHGGVKGVYDIINSTDLSKASENVNYYSGQIASLTNQVDVFDEQIQLLNDTMQIHINDLYEEAEQYGISTEKVDELVASIKDGTFNADELSGSSLYLKDSLVNLASEQDKVKNTTEKLEAAQKKLNKANMDAAIQSDLTAGNYELAAARIEYALASEVYDGETAAKQMTTVMQQANTDIRASLLEDMSDDMRTNWNKYSMEADGGAKDLAKILNGMNDDEKEAFSTSYEKDMTEAMKKTMDSAQKVIDETKLDTSKLFDFSQWDMSHPLKSLKSLFTKDWSWKLDYASYDVGTSYVPNDGFAYIHKGEAIVPADENVFARQGDAWATSIASNDKLVSIMTSLENTIKQGISVSGEFKQKGSDLVATVNKVTNKNGNQALSNMAYAR